MFTIPLMRNKHRETDIEQIVMIIVNNFIHQFTEVDSAIEIMLIHFLNLSCLKRMECMLFKDSHVILVYIGEFASVQSIAT